MAHGGDPGMFVELNLWVIPRVISKGYRSESSTLYTRQVSYSLPNFIWLHLPIPPYVKMRTLDLYFNTPAPVPCPVCSFCDCASARVDLPLGLPFPDLSLADAYRFPTGCSALTSSWGSALIPSLLPFHDRELGGCS